MSKRKNAVYARQSLEKPGSLSIEDQISVCIEQAGNDCLVYSDPGYSGKNMKRPAMQKLIDDVKANKISTVYAYKLDRIGRNVTDFYQFLDILNYYDVNLIAVNDNIDTNDKSHGIHMGLYAVFAQVERESTSQRVKGNYYYRIAKDGRWAGGPAPYGFKNARNEQNAPTLEPYEPELKAVRDIFHLYSSVPDISLAKVGRILSARGYRGRKREVFDSITIARILQSPVYVKADRRLYTYLDQKGIRFLLPDKMDIETYQRKWDGSRSCHIVGKRSGNKNIRKYTSWKEQAVYLTNFPGYISSDVYIAVQERLKLNEQLKRANSPTNMHELAGKLKCGHCHYAIKLYNHKYLRCYGQTVLKVCEARFPSADLTEIRREVEEKVCETLGRIQEIGQSSAQQVENLEEAYQELEKQKNTCVKQIIKYADTDVEAAFQQELENIVQQQKDIRAQQENIKGTEILPFTVEQYLSCEESVKKLVIQELIERIELFENGDIHIIWKINKLNET